MRYGIRMTVMLALASLAALFAGAAPAFAQASSSTAKLRGQVTDSIGFTSAFDPRQLQFGARFNF